MCAQLYSSISVYDFYSFIQHACWQQLVELSKGLRKFCGVEILPGGGFSGSEVYTHPATRTIYLEIYPGRTCIRWSLPNPSRIRLPESSHTALAFKNETPHNASSRSQAAAIQDVPYNDMGLSCYIRWVYSFRCTAHGASATSPIRQPPLSHTHARCLRPSSANPICA